MREFSYQIVKHIATLSEDEHGNTLQMNIIAYNGYAPKLDLRRWKKGDIMLKGLVLTDDETEALYEALKGWMEK